jgi:hypothetical protein
MFRSSDRHSPELRCEERFSDSTLWISAPFRALAVDCSINGLGIETSEELPVGATWPVALRTGEKEIVLIGTIRWARLDRTRALGNGDVEPVYRAGLAFMDGMSIERWRRAFSRVLRRRASTGFPGRTVVRWQKPSA